MKIEGDDIFLSSGKQLDVHCGILGLAREDNRLLITEGFDGYVDHYCFSCEEGTCTKSTLTPEEKIEVADYMIAMWQEYKDSVK